jgi:hypothetical protein
METNSQQQQSYLLELDTYICGDYQFEEQKPETWMVFYRDGSYMAVSGTRWTSEAAARRYISRSVREFPKSYASVEWKIVKV